MVLDVLNHVNSDCFPESWVSDCCCGGTVCHVKVVLSMLVFVYMSFLLTSRSLKSFFFDSLRPV